MKNIAIIPARGGSKRVKNKNIIDFHGKPIIFYVLKTLQEAKIFDKIHVSTDSFEIKKVVEGFGFEVEFMRPDNLSDDLVGIIPFLEWVLNEYKLRGLKFDNICCALPTAPLILSNDIKKSYKTYLEKNCEYPLHAVAKIPVPIEWAFRIENDGLLSPISPEMLQKRSQDLQDAYYDAGAFSWFPAEYFIGKMNSKQKFLSYILEGNRSVDIDTEDDLELAKKLFRVINPK